MKCMCVCVCYNIENVKEQHQGEAERQSIQRERHVGMSAPARKALPLTRARANRLRLYNTQLPLHSPTESSRKALTTKQCVCYNIENVKEQHQGEAERQSIQRERKHP